MATTEDKLENLLLITVEMRGDLKLVLSRLDDHDKKAVDHEQRLRDLEKFKWKLIGIAAGLGTLSGGMVAALLKALMGV